jgi:Cu+-exporting ATPase
MEKCPVCGMEVEAGKAAGTTQYQGKTYYFCSKQCKTRFDANAAQYAS